MFKVGDEVVCVNDDAPRQMPPNVVVKGNTYTITAMEIRPRVLARHGPYVMMKPEWYVFLREVPSPAGVGFYAFRFRKVEKKARETDISVFKEIADGTRVVPLDDAPVKKKEKA